MKNYYKNFTKESVYDQYFIYLEDALDYDKITRYKMVDAMKAHFFAHKNEIVDALPLEAFKELQMIAQTIKKKGRYEKNYDLFAGSKIRLFAFLFDDYDLIEDTETFYMNASLAQYLSNYTINLETQEEKYFQQVILGMVSVYGAVTNEDMETMYEKGRPKEFKHLPMPRVNNLKFFHDRLMIDHYTVFSDAILHPMLSVETLDFPMGMINKVYDLAEYYNFSVSGIPPLFTGDIGNTDFSLILQDHLHSKLQHSDNLAKTLEALEQSEIFSFYSVNASIMDFWPIWKFGGMTFKDYLAETKNQLIEPSLQSPFLEYVHELVRYANKKYKYLPKNTEIFVQDAFEIIKKSVKRKDFLKHLNASQAQFKKGPFLEITKGFENAVMIDMGIAYKYEKDKLLVHHDGIVYHVSGITMPISENISEHSLPLYVNVVIIPLADTLTYALSLSCFPIVIGSSMRALLDDEVRSSKHVYNLEDIKMLKAVGTGILGKH